MVARNLTTEPLPDSTVLLHERLVEQAIGGKVDRMLPGRPNLFDPLYAKAVSNAQASECLASRSKEKHDQ